MTIAVILFAIGLCLLIGALFALPARLPRLQSRAIGDKSFRNRLIIGLGIAAFLAVYLGIAWLYAGHQAARFQTWIVLSSGLEYVSQIGVQREIWLRLILLNSESNACFNPAPEICEMVTLALSDESIGGFRWVVIAFPMAFIAAISGLTAAFFVRVFTRYDDKVKRDKSKVDDTPTP